MTTQPTTTLPTYDQVLQLPATTRRTVPEDFIDENGHMNIGRYLELASWAAWGVTTDVGMGPSYIDDRGLSLFTVEHHLRYFAEMRQGDELSVHVRLVERSARALHCLTSIVDRTHERLAYTCELMMVHIDMATRRTTPFPDDVAKGLDAVLASHDLDWAPPLCGVMSVRR